MIGGADSSNASGNNHASEGADFGARNVKVMASIYLGPVAIEHVFLNSVYDVFTSIQYLVRKRAQLGKGDFNITNTCDASFFSV